MAIWTQARALRTVATSRNASTFRGDLQAEGLACCNTLASSPGPHRTTALRHN